ncbi:hypothetical protein ACWGR3_28935 [Streptomyces albidoflavus]
MATVTTGLVIDLNDSDEGTTSVGFRRALAVLFKQSSPGVATPGRLGADHFVVSGAPSSMEYTVSAGGLVLVRSSSNGAYLVGMPTAVTFDTDPSDGVNPRIDRIYAKQPDPPLDGSAVDTEFIIDVVCGAPAASPLLPALPAGAFELARKVIAAGAANTQAGAGFTDIAAVTGLNLGVIDAAQIPDLPASKITSGQLPISRGGTGASSKATARTNFGFLSGTAAPGSGLGDDGDTYDQII